MQAVRWGGARRRVREAERVGCDKNFPKKVLDKGKRVWYSNKVACESEWQRGVKERFRKEVGPEGPKKFLKKVLDKAKSECYTSECSARAACTL